MVKNKKLVKSDKYKKIYFVIFSSLVFISLISFFYFPDFFKDNLSLFNNTNDLELFSHYDEFELLENEEYHFFFQGFEDSTINQTMILFFNSRQDKYLCNISLYLEDNKSMSFNFNNILVKKREKVFLNLGELDYGRNKFIGYYNCSFIN